MGEGIFLSFLMNFVPAQLACSQFQSSKGLTFSDNDAVFLIIRLRHQCMVPVAREKRNIGRTFENPIFHLN